MADSFVAVAAFRLYIVLLLLSKRLWVIFTIAEILEQTLLSVVVATVVLRLGFQILRLLVSSTRFLHLSLRLLAG